VLIKGVASSVSCCDGDGAPSPAVVVVVVLLDFLVKDIATDIFARVKAYSIDSKNKLQAARST